MFPSMVVVVTAMTTSTRFVTVAVLLGVMVFTGSVVTTVTSVTIVETVVYEVGTAFDFALHVEACVEASLV